MSNTIHLCYAEGKYKKSQQICSNSALQIGGFSRSYMANRSHLSKEFVDRNSQILNQPRGAGYWLWKPYIILQALEHNPGALICYTDSGMYFQRSFIDLAEQCLTINPIVSFDYCGVNGQFTKRDCLHLMNRGDPSAIEHCRQQKQRMASVLVFRSCPIAIDFVTLWLMYCCDSRILTDASNITGENFPEFKDHRHDQSVFSILADRYSAHTYVHPEDVTQFMNKNPYLIHHRNPE